MDAQVSRGATLGVDHGGGRLVLPDGGDHRDEQVHNRPLQRKLGGALCAHLHSRPLLRHQPARFDQGILILPEIDDLIATHYFFEG